MAEQCALRPPTATAVLPVRRSATFYIMDENEIPEGLVQALENIAEMLPSTLPTVQAVAQTGAALQLLAQLIEPVQSLAAGLQAQLDQPFQLLAASLQAQLTQPFDSLAILQAQLVEPLQSLAALQVQAAMRSALGIMSTALQYTSLNATVRAGLAFTPPLPVHAEVVETKTSTDVDMRPESQPDIPQSADFAALAIKLLWAWALTMPLITASLSPEDQTTIALYIATISLALIITWRHNDTRKH
jgi:hypothetical protein